jgi:hypothetical protein
MGRKSKTDLDRASEYERLLTPELINTLKEWDKYCEEHSANINFSLLKRKDFESRDIVKYFISSTPIFYKATRELDQKLASIDREAGTNGDTFFSRSDFEKSAVFNANTELSKINAEAIQTQNGYKLYFHDPNSIFYTESLPPHLNMKYPSFFDEEIGKYINPVFGIFADNNPSIKETSQRILFDILASQNILGRFRKPNLHLERLMSETYFSYHSSRNKQITESPRHIDIKFIESKFNKYFDTILSSRGLKDILNFTFQRQDLYIFALRSRGVGIDRIISDQHIYLNLIYNGSYETMVMSGQKNVSTRYFKICSFLGEYGADLIENIEKPNFPPNPGKQGNKKK